MNLPVPPHTEAPSLAPILTVRSVARRYQQGDVIVTALSDASLTLSRGEFVALVGPSGSGKSTLLNLIGLNDTPSAGEIELVGERFGAVGSDAESSDARRTRARRYRLGFLFQNFHLLPSLSVIENCIIPALLIGVASAKAVQRASELLRSVGLNGYEERLPHQLSGGEMQRVALCRALIHEPALILADEPTGALDEGTSKLVLQLLRRVTEQGTAILMATHSPEAMAESQRVLRIRDGVLRV